VGIGPDLCLAKTHPRIRVTTLVLGRRRKTGQARTKARGAAALPRQRAHSIRTRVRCTDGAQHVDIVEQNEWRRRESKERLGVALRDPGGPYVALFLSEEQCHAARCVTCMALRGPTWDWDLSKPVQRRR